MSIRMGMNGCGRSGMLMYENIGKYQNMVKMVKPDADIYQCLFDTYGLKPEECVFLDDRPENIEGGEKLGMRGIVFESYEDAKAKLEKML